MPATRHILALILALGLLPGTALAQQAMQHQGHMGGMPSMGDMQGAMTRMQQGMDLPSSGNVDVDFARMMIPHHQGAIDMAKVELAQGKDPKLRKLAEEIIAAQEKEIEFLKSWLAKHDG